MAKKKFDFCGWATKNNIRCADGRTIMRDAFAEQDGVEVPLVWSHDHSSPDKVLGHCLLENRPEGVYAYGTFNNTPLGKTGRELVANGDVKALSINAGQLKHNEHRDVLHGVIREVSLVLAGANPGAMIEYPILAHSGETSYEECVIFTSDEDAELEMYHADEPEKKEEKEVAEEKKTDDKTIEDIFNTLNDEQKDAVYAIVGAALEEAEHEADGEDFYDEGEDEVMKHNIFETDTNRTEYLSHADGAAIVELAKKGNIGTLSAAMEEFAAENGLELMHTGDVASSSGFYQTSPTEGAGNITWLFPEFKDLKPGAPELVTYDQGWVNTVISKVHKSPISRIRTGQVDIRNIDELRARGYKKGTQKKLTGNFNLVRRTTEPTTIYVKSQLHRDDIIDITDFDYVQYLYNIDRLHLNEELAMAMLFGDGRSIESEDKIAEDKIRPIWTDDELYTIHYDIDEEGARAEIQGSETDSYFGDNYVRAEAMINACLYSREDYKGSGQPDMFIAPHELNVMLLARDRNGRRIYSSKAELAAAFNVGNIFTIEQLGGNGKSRTDGEGASAKTKKLLCLIVNLADYSLGATKGGEITHFTQFDIDFNLQKSLLETRCSGALTRIKSAIAIEEVVA